MNTRESTLAAIRRYRDEFGDWPNMSDLLAFVPDRVQPKLAGRLEALLRGGHITSDAHGRIVGATGTTTTETV